MKKVASYICFIWVVFLASCSEKEIPSPSQPGGNAPNKEETGITKEKEVYFTTQVQTQVCTNVLNELNENQSLGVKMVYTTDSTENGTKELVYNNGQWKGKPSITIKENDHAKLYAFYPYSATLSSGKYLPIEMESQTDYLYSKEASISYSSPTTQITLNHALSVMSFNIDKSTYAGNGTLQSIQIEGDNFYTQGILDITTGTVTATEKGKFTLEKEFAISTEGRSANLLEFFCLPTHISPENVKLSFNIDGKVFTCTLPGMGVFGNTKYILQFTLSDSQILLNEEEGIIEVPLGQETADKATYSFMGLTHTNKEFTAPTLHSMNGVVATIQWGDSKSEPYALGLKHTYTSEGPHTVLIEGYGIQEYKLNNLVGVTQIDIIQ